MESRQDSNLVCYDRLFVITLFDNLPRAWEFPSGYSEPSFEYLNRSANEPIRRIRDVLEDWFSRYPASHQEDLRRRFRTRKEHNHSAALFELWLHELLFRMRCQVQIHPTLPHTERKPDFLVKEPSGLDFYLEAIHTAGASDEESNAQARLNRLYDSLNYLQSPNFFLNINVSGLPRTPVRGREIRRILERELSRLRPESIDHFLDNRWLDRLPQWNFEHDGLRITCSPIPKPPELRGRPGVRTLGFKTFGGKIDSEGPIKHAVIKKAGHYGNLDRPLVVAVNATDLFLSDRDVLNALYGSFQGWPEPELLNDERGVWGNRNNPKWTRVSAALITLKLRSDKLVVPATLHHHPHAARPYSGELTRLPQTSVTNNRLISSEGKTIGSILGLHSDFPEDNGKS
jgi:hypothetical protein